MPVPVFTAGEILTAANMNQVGLWLVKSQAIGTAVTQTAITNCFTPDYDNYRIVINVDTTTVGGPLLMQLGSMTTFNYVSNGINITWQTSVTNNVSVQRPNWVLFVNAGTTANTNVVMDVFYPQKTQTTFATSQQTNQNGAAFSAHGTYVTTSFTGFTLLMGSGTMTGGNIRVYGYRN